MDINMNKLISFSEAGILSKVIVIILIILALNILIPSQATAQEQISLADRVKQLQLDSTYTGLWVYYSAGHELRAVSLGEKFAASNAFYSRQLGIEVEIIVALLDTVDYQRISPVFPYGLPFISGRTAVMPADLSTGAVREMYLPYEATVSDEIRSDLRANGYTFREAVNLMIDLIGLHEIGHSQIWAYNLDTRQPWFNEFMASYFGYAWMRSEEPAMATIWDRITQAGIEGYTPTNHRLDVLNELYAGVGVGDYVWYQNVFQNRIREVYDMAGLDFIRLVQYHLADNDFRPESASSLLQALEEIEPGFLAWAEKYQLD
jgi:hypothetical protein